MITQKVFNLNSKADFIRAEWFKLKLENKGLRVICAPRGFNGVFIKGVFNG